MLQQYTEQVGSGNKTAAIDMSRFRLETPKSDKGWQEAVDNSRVQIEYQNARIENLELMSKFGNAEWILYNQHCEAILDKIKKQTQEIESEIIAVNRTRQQEQLHTSKILESQALKQQDLISSIFQIRQANAVLESRLENKA